MFIEKDVVLLHYHDIYKKKLKTSECFHFQLRKQFSYDEIDLLG